MDVLPTPETYDALQRAYHFFNVAMFAGELPNCLITLQRRKRSYGFFSGNRFEAEDGRRTDEIALNPSFFVEGVEETLSTLVHEMAHLWQHHHGEPGRRGYHNKEWATKMVELGLVPTDTGAEGGKMVGEKITHMIAPAGAFREKCRELISSGYRLSWRDVPEAPSSEGEGEAGEEGEGADQPKKNKSNRLKFKCPRCEAQAWARPAARLLCGGQDCEAAALEPAE